MKIKNKECLIFMFSILSAFMSCTEQSRLLPKKGWNGTTHFTLERIKEIFHQQIYNAGPSGWMIEWKPSVYEISTFIFCTNGKCNHAKQETEFNGSWFFDGDSIYMLFNQETITKGIGKPIPWEGEMKHKDFYQYASYKQISNAVNISQSLSWLSITQSVFNENEYPYELISVYSECDTFVVNKDSLNQAIY